MVDLNRVFSDHAWAANATQASTVAVASQFFNATSSPSFTDVLADTESAADEFETPLSQSGTPGNNPLMPRWQSNDSCQSPASGSSAPQNDASQDDLSQNDTGHSTSSTSETPRSADAATLKAAVQPAPRKEEAKGDIYIQSASKDRSVEATPSGKSKHSKAASNESSAVQTANSQFGSNSARVAAPIVNDASSALAPRVSDPPPAPGDQVPSNNQKTKSDDSNSDLAFAMRVQGAGSSPVPVSSLSTPSPAVPDPSIASSTSPFTAQLSAMLAPSGSKAPVTSGPRFDDSSAGSAALTLAGSQTGAPSPGAVSTDSVEEETSPVITEPTEATTPQTQPVKAVQVQVAGADNQRVEVRLLEKSGALTISVRSTDSNLTKALQQNLPELNSKLNEQQIRAEWWKPGIQAGDSLTKPESSLNSGGNGNSTAQDQSGRDKGNSDQQGGRSARQTDWLEELSNLHKSTQNGTQFSWQL